VDSSINFSAAEVGIVGSLLTALGAAIIALYRQSRTLSDQRDSDHAAMLKALETRLAAVVEDRDTYRSMAEEAITYLDSIRNRARGQRDESDFPHVRRVPPEHNSDPTRIAENHADASSLRARLDSASRDLARLSDLDYADYAAVDDTTKEPT